MENLTEIEVIIFCILYLLVGIIIGIIFSVKIDPGDKYKDGQIDALNNDIKYSLQTDKKGESKWKKIKKQK